MEYPLKNLDNSEHLSVNYHVNDDHDEKLLTNNSCLQQSSFKSVNQESYEYESSSSSKESEDLKISFCDQYHVAVDESSAIKRKSKQIRNLAHKVRRRHEYNYSTLSTYVPPFKEILSKPSTFLYHLEALPVVNYLNDTKMKSNVE